MTAVVSWIGSRILRVPLPASLLRLLRALPLSSSRFRHLRYRGTITLRAGPWTIRMRSRLPGDSALFWRGWPEPGSVDVWLALVRTADVVFDVGASAGIYSLLAAAANPSARVYGFEPYDLAFAALTENLALNDARQVTPIHAAVGETDGSTRLYVDPEKPAEASRVALPDAPRRHRTVPLVSIRSFAERNGIDRIDCLKIDVEGGEPDVLRGMGPLLGTRPSMIVEVLRDETGRLLERLLGNGYAFYWIDEDRGPVRRESIRRVHRTSRNYLFCAQELAGRLALP